MKNFIIQKTMIEKSSLPIAIQGENAIDCERFYGLSK